MPISIETLNTNAPVPEGDRVLVIVQLNGGNDGLNTVLPRDQYSAYLNARGSIAIQESAIRPVTLELGFHPVMSGLHNLFDAGRLSVIQNVGYENTDQSHFRSTDIWMSASDRDQVLTTGWAGRALNLDFPNYPTGYPNSLNPDPPALKISSTTSLLFQGIDSNLGISVKGVSAFYDFFNGVEEPAPPTLGGAELTYVRNLVRQTELYNAAIRTAAEKVTLQGPYPDTPLAQQLKVVARLIAGGIKTRIFLVTQNGFDTHANQAVVGATSTGVHAELLRELSDGIKAFMDDVTTLGVSNRVMGMTFSEFGRRIKANGSSGTDHGTAQPMFVFGNYVKTPGIIGPNPVLPASAVVEDNLPVLIDYRQVYNTMLTDWLGYRTSQANDILLRSFDTVDVIDLGTTVVPPSPPDPPTTPSGGGFVVGKEPSSVTIPYYRGNPFQQTFTIANASAPTFAIGKISRIGDPDREALILFAQGNGLTISGQDINLSKTVQEMILPPGKYEFSLEATVDGAVMALTKDSFFVIADVIQNILPQSSSITATSISSSQQDVAWASIPGANNYRLWRALSINGPWAQRYEGPNTAFEEAGLSPLTQYFWRVEGSGPGYEGSGYAYTNATTLADTGVSGLFIPAGGSVGQVLQKTGPNDEDYEWVDTTIPPDPDGSETVVQEGDNVTITGSGTNADPYIISATAPGTSGGGAYTGDLLP